MSKRIKDYIYLFKFAAKYTHFVWWCIADGIIWGINNSVANVVFIKYLFDMIEQKKSFAQIMVLIALIGTYMLLIYVFHEKFYQFVKPRTEQELHEKMHSRLFGKAMSLDLAKYDDPEFYNDYVWVMNNFEGEVMDVAFDIGKFINRLLATSVIVTLVATIDVTVVIAIAFAVALSVVIKYFRTKLEFAKQGDLKPSERKAEYVGRVFYLADYAEEIRLSRASEILDSDFSDALDEQIAINKKYGKKLLLCGMLRDLTSSALINVGIITLLVYKIMVEGSISLGDFAASIGGTWALFWQLNNLLEYFTKSAGHGMYAEKLKKFLECEPAIGDTDDSVSVPEFASLTLRDMSFSYGSSDKKVLKNINLTINKNEKIALVGYNGAGKSTLIKLIMRLYDPTSGSVEWNGENIKNLKVDEYRGKFGTVFQDFQIFAVSVAENVKADVVEDGDSEKIKAALDRSGLSAKVSELPHGIDTEVTREFSEDGANLSGGERQKLAIARAFMKDADLIILDEPSSALDPMSEYELNHTMMDAASDKTVIFISHRLSTTIMADRIYMLADGEIIEEGSHEELMKRDGKYAEMFRMQAEKYQKEYIQGTAPSPA
ncbi:MAG: ABC transporter ATP-binding protein [Clostridiales bacterium]|nr:ABC transporter ATP-binding protein [Clostridiales bacterium]